MDLSELKAAVRCHIQASGGSILIVRLETEFRSTENTSLKAEAQRFQFNSIASMIKTWPGFKISGFGLSTTVTLEEVDHIFEMNRRSKCSGNRRRQCGFRPLFNNREARLPLIGKDPYAFSSDTQSEHSSDEWDKVPTLPAPVVPKTDPAPEKPTSPVTNNSRPAILKIAANEIPQCPPIENFNEMKKIVLLDHLSPHRFWFAEHTQSKKLLEMTKKMTEVYEKEGDRLKMEKKDVQVGQVIVIKFHSFWHRARIVKVMPEHLRIFYIDYGTAEVVKVENARSLLEDFASEPAIARRGVLSHVQPVNSTWCDKSKEFFFNHLVQQKVDTKILKRDESQNCYFVAIKLSTDKPGPKVLLTTLMIENNFCSIDSEFLVKEKYTNEQDFEFYENGEHLPDPKAEETDDDWLPVAANEQKPEDCLPGAVSKAEEASVKSVASTFSRFSFSKLAETRSKAAPVHHVIEKPLSRQKLMKNASAVTNDSRIPVQDMQHFEVGSKLKIYVNAVVDHRSFYFFLQDELADIAGFLDTFDEVCGNNHSPCKDFTINAEVATYEDENYCRGRIVAHKGDEDLYEIFLVDYGTAVERTGNDLFKLSDAFKQRPPAAYKGALANLPEHIHIKTKEKLVERVSQKLQDAKIVRVEGNTVELLLFG